MYLSVGLVAMCSAHIICIIMNGKDSSEVHDKAFPYVTITTVQSNA